MTLTSLQHDRTGVVLRLTPRRQATSRRRGVAVIIVLMLLSLTLVMSYAILRSQAGAYQIANNGEQRGSARRAAITGLTVALRKMNESNWGGVGTSINGSLSATESYTVTFTAGDAALTAGSSEYAEIPYRVTLLSTGTCSDPGSTQAASTFKIEAVARLIPTNVATEPSIWASTRPYTVYQKYTDPFRVEVPSRMEGPLRLQGAVTLSQEYLWNGTARSRFFSDLNAMRNSGYSDQRPFSGPISLPTGSTDLTTLSTLSSTLGISLTNISQTSRPTITMPSSLSTYRMYPGGPTYSVPQLGSTIQSTTLQDDPATNPLGLFFCNQSLTIKSNVTIRGTLIATGDIHVNGTNVQFQSVSLPALFGATSPQRLPVAVTKGNFYVDATGGGACNGILLVDDLFQVENGPSSPGFQIVGQLIADEVRIRGRTDWNQAGLIWTTWYTTFTTQLLLPSGVRINYFPVWLGTVGLNYVPNMTIKQDTATYTSHWQDMSQPVYSQVPTNQGLRWDLLRWTNKS